MREIRESGAARVHKGIGRPMGSVCGGVGRIDETRGLHKGVDWGTRGYF